MIGAALKAVAVLLGCLIAADVVGVLACTILDIATVRRWSVAVPYTVWLVCGVFCGLHAYNLAGLWASPRIAGQDWIEQAGARRLGNVILVMCIALLAPAAGLLYAFLWQQGAPADDYYVPDSAPHSILFLLSVLAGMLLARFVFMPARQADASG